MDSSQYKDYILTLLFVKYVSDKFKGVTFGDIDVPEGGSFDDMLALIGNKNIGELARANSLRGVIDNAHFNDEDSAINDVLKGNDNLDKLGLNNKLKDEGLDADDKAVLESLQILVTRIDDGTKAIKDLRTAPNKKACEQYPKLTDGQCLELLLNRKWYRSIINGIYALYAAVSHCIADRISKLNARYEQTLPALETEVAQLEDKVKSHLARMGFAW
jgi:type I restriction enzyme M protein